MTLDMIDAGQRARTMRTLTVMVADDTVDPLADRVERLATSRRRMTLVCQWVGETGPPDTMLAGLRPREVSRWRRADAAGVCVRLDPGIESFGFGVSLAHPAALEEDVWDRWHAGERTSITQVAITGGLAGDGPARDDQIVIHHWDAQGVCRQVLVAFDYGPDPEDPNEGIGGLVAAATFLDQTWSRYRWRATGPDRTMVDTAFSLLGQRLADVHQAPDPTSPDDGVRQ